MSEAKKYGCEHYKRKCALIVCEKGYLEFSRNHEMWLYQLKEYFLFQAPCCGKKYTCRVCHDDTEDHELIRKKVNRVHCLTCDKVQQVREFRKINGIMKQQQNSVKWCSYYDIYWYQFWTCSFSCLNYI